MEGVEVEGSVVSPEHLTAKKHGNKKVSPVINNDTSQ